MPPRYAYWTILAGGLPTAFRAAEREDLLPTLKRIAATHPDAEMKWFARGRLWDSPAAAREAPRPAATGRGRDWRPGGDHRDPRQAFTDAKKARNSARRQERFTRKSGATAAGKAAVGKAAVSKAATATPGARKPPTGRRPAGVKPDRSGAPPGRAHRGPSRGPARPGRGPRGPKGGGRR